MDSSISSALIQGVLIGLLVVLLYKYLTRNFDYWKKQGVKYVTPKLIVGTYKSIYNQYLFEQDIENHRKLGPVFGGFQRNLPILQIADPEIIKQVFVTNYSDFTDRRHLAIIEKFPLINRTMVCLNGEEWKIMRTVVSRAFSSAKLKQMIHSMEDVLKVFIQSLDRYAMDKKPVNIRELVSAFSLDMTAACTFGMNTNTVDNPNNEFARNHKRFLNNPSKILDLFAMFPILVSTFGWLLGLLVGRYVNFFAITAATIMENKIANKSVKKTLDFLDCLLEAKAKAQSIGDEKTNKVLDAVTIAAQCFLFMAVSMESIPTTVSMIAYSLATNAEIQEKLIREIDQLLIEKKGIVTYEDIINLQYLDMVLNEGLRTSPPFYRLMRTCGADGVTLNNGITLNKGMVVIVSIYAMHHDPQYFTDPDTFNPERFSPEKEEKINMNAFIPFGLGPKQCIGMRFATIAAKLTIFNILSKYRLKTCFDTETTVKFIRTRSTFLTPVSVTLLLEARKDQPQQLIM